MRKRAAVLGSPISHSLSPAIHNAAYLALGIEGKYDAVEVKENELEGFIREVDRTPADWIGFSLTMPLKEEIFKVADVVDPLAKQIFSANTLIPTLEGWFATSTDVAGFIWALAENEVQNFETVTIIGAGATARAAIASVDAPDRKIRVINRSTGREKLIREIVHEAKLEFLSWEDVRLDSDLVINTTPKGVADNLPAGSGVLFESLYDPWPTSLADKWQGQIISGIDLLVHQAIDQIHLMTGFVIDRKLMSPILKTAALAELKDRK